MPKVLIVAASPRPRGHSTLLALEAARGAEDAGAEVRTVRLADLDFGPCRACEKCRRPGAKGCVQEDDLKALAEDIRTADSLLIATPVYWFTMSGPAKLFMDRLYVFGAKGYRELKGKWIGIILTSGDPDFRVSGAANAARSFRDAFAYLGAPIVGIVHGSAGKPGGIRRKEGLVKRAYALGRSLARSRPGVR